MAEVCPHYCLFFRFWLSSGGKKGSKLDQKGTDQKLWVRPLFINTRILQKIFKQYFLFARVLPLVRISATLDHIGGVRAQKPPKKAISWRL